MARREIIGWALLGGGLVLSLAVEATVYRWLDEQGRVQFGDRPPAHRQVEQIELKVPPSAPGNTSTPEQTLQQRREVQQKMLDAYRDEREQRQQRRQKRAAEQARRKRACVEARDRLRLYQSSGALYELEPDGSRRFLSAEQYEAALVRARKRVAQRCRGDD